MNFFFRRKTNQPSKQLTEIKDTRKSDVTKWWAYYYGIDSVTGFSQWSYLYSRFPAMPVREIEDIENHTRICADRLRRLLVNSWRGFEFSGAKAGKTVGAVFDTNRWPHLLNLIVLYGKVTGDAFVKLTKVSAESEFAPLRMTLLDTGSVELEVSPHDRNDVRKVRISYDFFEKDPDYGGLRKRKYLEIIDNTSVTAYIDGEYEPGYSFDHGLGFIPVVHIRNSDNGGGIYGESFVSRMVEAQDSLNLLTTDLVDIVRYDGHKTTIFQNVNIDKGASRDGRTEGEIDLSIGKGLVVKGEGRVYKLEQQNDLGAALQEYDRKLDAFYSLAGVPRITQDTVSKWTVSGKAIERLYQDAIDSTREAQGLYGESFCELANKVAAMTGCPPVSAKALWNTDVIAPDIDTLKKELDAGVRSVKSAMKKLGINDADGMMDEMKEE